MYHNFPLKRYDCSLAGCLFLISLDFSLLRPAVSFLHPPRIFFIFHFNLATTAVASESIVCVRICPGNREKFKMQSYEAIHTIPWHESGLGVNFKMKTLNKEEG